MMIKANGEYLDFNGDIEIESRIRLFETDDPKKLFNGDFSYDSSCDDNGFNRKILGIPRADTVKTIHQKVPSEIISDEGESIYLGKLQINKIEAGQINFTFFSGNTEWFSQLSEPMSSLPLYRYDVDLTEADIQASWNQSDGIVFPIIDTGALITRSFRNLKIEDFTACFYVKTLFDEIFNPKGIKVTGDFIEDPTFKKLVIASNTKSQDEVDNRSSYIQKSSDQITAIPAVVTLTNESIFPYFDGSLDNFSTVTSRYTADVKMVVNAELTIKATTTSALFAIRRNGTGQAFAVINTPGGSVFDTELILNAGDYIDISVTPLVGSTTIETGTTLKITPQFIYKSFGVSSVPHWTQMQFVSNILRIFNVLPSYNATSKTLTLDLFNNIKNKEYVDISNEVVVDTVDFSEFVSGYAKNNYFKYQESEEEDLRQYNISNFISYGSGNLTIDNDYIENSKDIVESDFTSPITYLNGVFDMSMERINFVELETVGDEDITSVTDSGGIPRFNTAIGIFSSGDLVRVESDIDSYNGDWVINIVGGGFVTVNGLLYESNATGTISLLRHKFTDDDSVYIFVNVPTVPTTFFSSRTLFYLEDGTPFSTTSIAYFNLLSNGTGINKVYKQSLSFGEINSPVNYQLSLIDTYWTLFYRILNDPVKILGSGYLKRTTFDKVKSFLRPVMIQTEETRNLYYLNVNRGYKGSERPCGLELIKLN